jgi:hypothetical protein
MKLSPTQTDHLVPGKELRDCIAIRSRGNLGLIEQYEMVVAVPAFDHRNSKLASIAAETVAKFSTVVISRSLTMSAMSSTFSSALMQALIEERHFALVDGFALSNLGSL